MSVLSRCVGARSRRANGYIGRFEDFFLRMSLAASLASPRIMPELLRMASGHKMLAAFRRVVKSSALIFAFTWTVRFPVVSISPIVTSVLFHSNDTVSIFRTTGQTYSD
jgi:hypothetical protein